LEKRARLKSAEEDHDLDMLDSTRPDRLRLHKHMDSWIVKCLKAPSKEKHTKKNFVDKKKNKLKAKQKELPLHIFLFVHHTKRT
jgi:hypothetical protein